MSKVILKRSSIPNKVPLVSDLEYGELAINYHDGVAYFKKSDNTIGTIGSSSFSQAHSFTYTATSGQQSFAASYDFGRAYVYLNGVKQVAGTDFTAITGNSIDFVSGLIAGDIVDIVSYSGSDDIPKLPTTDIIGASDTQTLTNKTINFANNTLTGIQAELISGTNIKTINGSSILGSGNVDIDALPPQANKENQFLKTDGTNASWSILPTTLNILSRTASTVSISLANGVIPVLSRGGSTISVSVS